MALNIKRPNGTEDVTGKNICKWHTVERTARDVASEFGFHEIRIPTFENTELFQRSVGETTDVVQKEMYSVIAKETKFTLRPEGTAGTIRAMMQNGLLNEALPQKVFYILSCFRHERPQAGRLREFHQFGVEMAGSRLPSADADVILMAHTIISQLGIKNVALKLNSIGCPKCRAEYHKALKSYFENKKDELCDTCLSRLEKNPMRILDCKSPICSEIAKDAPVILDFLCDECSDHFDKLKSYLKNLGLEFTVDPKIVRGLDYYTKTVFEFVTTDIGAQGTICGGGRYDGLIGQLGGQETPALGFAMGLERLILTMENQGINFDEDLGCSLYIAPMDENAVPMAMKIAKELRTGGFCVEFDTVGRGLKAQMKYSDKIGAAFTMVLGDNEINENKARLKNMKTGEQVEVKLDENLLNVFSSIALDDMFKDVLN
ncbi:MAG: histidine--tRNA ligase [Clostridium sp.]|nr:histidine--tRNA ligase [Clostridium sp.]MCM1547779.1 histidine--tRNA ligase [Ruminococcus sp.]